jgi:hypothetical protein
MISNLKLGAPFMKRSAVKLFSIVINKGIWDAESTYDRAPKKLYHVGGDGSKCLSFGPFGEVVYCDKKEPLLSFSRWHGSDYVDPSFCEWPGRGDRAKFFWGFLHHPSKSLTLVTLSNQPDHCWLVVPGSHCFVC